MGKRRLLHRVALLALAAVALGAIVVESGQLPHLHGDGTLGLYNEQHVFATLLGTRSGVATLPTVPAAVPLAVLVGLVALFEGPLRAVAAARHAGPRAPPAR
jgi:hypothetical protein